QQLVQPLVERMSRRRRQLGVRDPNPFLLLPLLARAHRHSAILRTISVDTSDVFAYESRLAPRAARERAKLRITYLGSAPLTFNGMPIAAAMVSLARNGHISILSSARARFAHTPATTCV